MRDFFELFCTKVAELFWTTRFHQFLIKCDMELSRMAEVMVGFHQKLVEKLFKKVMRFYIDLFVLFLSLIFITHLLPTIRCVVRL